ncbi:hypothetical protein L6452_42556 [Arctium lappa]|uniref:Uncharacterized protein n=1 Tax=Arctium lappa TaxID=4217 RepID=A0ACB8XIL5_ARCLA|nr:hypothetical protein L6452_42556 [Arctium lappa]
MDGMVAPGFRFFPTEEELISFYLKHKLHCSSNSNIFQQIHRVIPQLHVYDFYPWNLPQYAGELCHGDHEQWFFFIPRQEKEARGGRPSRLTSSGYWKATGSSSIVYSSSCSSSSGAIGIKRTMVFYHGRAPAGKKTEWKMNEYKAFKKEASSKANPKSKLMQEFSLCRLYVKSNCLRAFDRRPPSAAIIESRPIQQALQNDNHATTSSHFNRPSILVRKRSSSDRKHNSIGDQSPTMETVNQPSWDCKEHCNWF